MADPEVSILITAKDEASKALKKIGVSGEGIKQAFKAVGVAALAATAVIAVGVTKAVTAFTEFQKGMAEVTTLADFSTEQIREMTEETLDFSIAFNQATDALNQARYDVVSAGFADMAEQTLIMAEASKAAVAGVSDVATTTDLLTTVLNAYQLPASEAARINDLLFTTVKVGKTNIDQMAASWGNLLPAANAANISLEDVGASFGTLTAAGISSSEAVTALNGLFNKLAAATPESKRAMDELGISVKDADGNLKSMGEIIQEFQGMDLETVRRILPDESASKAILSLTANFEKYKESVEAFDPEAMTGATDKAFEIMSKTIDFQLGQLGKRWDAFWISILQGEAGEALAQSLEDLNTWFDENQETVAAASEFMAQFAGTIIDAVVPSINILKEIVFGLQVVWLLALAGVDEFATGVVNIWEFLAIATSNVWNDIQRGVLEVVQFIVLQLAETAASVAETANLFGISADAVRGLQASFQNLSASIQQQQNFLEGSKQEFEAHTSVLGLEKQAFEDLNALMDTHGEKTEAVIEDTQQMVAAQDQAVQAIDEVIAEQEAGAAGDGFDFVEEFALGMNEATPLVTDVMDTSLQAVTDSVESFDAQGLGNKVGSDIAAGINAGLSKVEFETPGAAQAAQIGFAQATATGLFDPSGALFAAAQQPFLQGLIDAGLATGFQHGGVATKATPGIFGEAGDEALIPLDDFDFGGGTVINEFNISFSGPLLGNDNDARLFAKRTVDFIQEELDRR